MSGGGMLWMGGKTDGDYGALQAPPLVGNLGNSGGGQPPPPALP